MNGIPLDVSLFDFVLLVCLIFVRFAPNLYDIYSTNLVFPTPVGPLNNIGIFTSYYIDTGLSNNCSR